MIIIFTLSYPYTIGKELTFLDDEILTITNSFNKTLIIPTIINEEKYSLNVDLNVNLSLASHLMNKKKYFSYFLKIDFYYFLIKEIYLKPTSLLHFKKLIINIINIINVLEWIENELDKNIENEKSKVILYTYWFTNITTALCYYYKKSSKVNIITRAHGIDLYEYRNNNYIPFREFTIKYLSRVYCVSENGKNYIAERYPKFLSKYFTFPLGVKAHKKRNNIVYKDIFHFVSCSNIDENKNVSLILDAMKAVAKKNKNKKIIWTHFGDGVLYNGLKEKVINEQISNLKVNLLGYKTNDKIFEFYENESLNAFVTTSLSEGGRPISVQEALSYGIPVIGTNVGGIPEIINNQNGILLSSKPKIEELIQAIESVIYDTEIWIAKREEAYRTWKEKCNSEVLTASFIDELKCL